MPIIRAAQALIFFAHVPKCGGSSVQDYLRDRFGPLAFEYRGYYSIPERERWSKTSPQHIDNISRDRMFPPGFFDASFAIVRHPVARLVSAYHFQMEVEKSLPEGLEFSTWLEGLPKLREENPFAYDNHVRPMDEIVPPEAKIFYLEHGLDTLVPWFDEVTGEKKGPRAIRHANKRGAYQKVSTQKASPSAADLQLIQELYAADFARFGYTVDSKAPAEPAPELSAELIRERDAQHRRYQRLDQRLARRVSKKLSRLKARL